MFNGVCVGVAVENLYIYGQWTSLFISIVHEIRALLLRITGKKTIPADKLVDAKWTHSDFLSIFSLKKSYKIYSSLMQ